MDTLQCAPHEPPLYMYVYIEGSKGAGMDSKRLELICKTYYYCIFSTGYSKNPTIKSNEILVTIKWNEILYACADYADFVNRIPLTIYRKRERINLITHHLKTLSITQRY